MNKLFVFVLLVISVNGYSQEKYLTPKDSVYTIRALVEYSRMLYLRIDSLQRKVEGLHRELDGITHGPFRTDYGEALTSDGGIILYDQKREGEPDTLPYAKWADSNKSCFIDTTSIKLRIYQRKRKK